MAEWKARLSDTRWEGDMLSCDVYTVTIYADTEEEVRSILAEAEPDLCIDRIERVEDDSQIQSDQGIPK